MNFFWLLTHFPGLKSICFSLALIASLPAAYGASGQGKKVLRISYISLTDAITDRVRAEAMRTALHELGYIDGKNILIEYRYAEGNDRRIAELAAELVRLNVDLIVVAGGDNIIRDVMGVTKKIPIVMDGQGSDPVRAGFIKSLARPGGNVTGITRLSRELGGKRLELLKQAVPKLARVAVLYAASVPGTAREVKEDLPLAGRAIGLTVQPWELRDVNDIDKVFVALKKERPSGLYLPGGGALMRSNEARIAGLALSSRLPSMYARREVVEAGGLMSYAADVTDSYRRIATYVNRIFNGANPAELPVEQPTKFELAVNLKTAKTIGVTIPTDVLARADRVIK
jgi:putative ABC transport system substrate-binding protein